MLKSKIRTWNKEEFGNIFEDKKRLIFELDQLSQKGMIDGWDEDMQKKRQRVMGATGGKGKIGRNLLGTKIQGQMAAGWGKEHQVLS